MTPFILHPDLVHSCCWLLLIRVWEQILSSSLGRRLWVLVVGAWSWELCTCRALVGFSLRAGWSDSSLFGALQSAAICVRRQFQKSNSFVSVYIDDVLIFSRSMEEHLRHISLVLVRLKPSKCHFVCQQVEYLGHLITPEELLPNPKKVSAVADFPTPTSATQVRQFVGLASYYRRFIEGFARIAGPLHQLTKQNADFKWTCQCQEALDTLKRELVEAPVLVYPNFDFGFVLELPRTGSCSFSTSCFIRCHSAAAHYLHHRRTTP